MGECRIVILHRRPVDFAQGEVDEATGGVAVYGADGGGVGGH
jgi:hypothetical protein